MMIIDANEEQKSTKPCAPAAQPPKEIDNKGIMTAAQALRKQFNN